jgi:hypothetical protein
MNTLTILALQANNEQIVSIVVVVVILAIAWIALRFVLLLATRIFTIGCGVIVLLGLLLLAFRLMG